MSIWLCGVRRRKTLFIFQLRPSASERARESEVVSESAEHAFLGVSNIWYQSLVGEKGGGRGAAGCGTCRAPRALSGGVAGSSTWALAQAQRMVGAAAQGGYQGRGMARA